MNKKIAKAVAWWILLILGGSYCASLYYAAWSFSTDDAYITLRYASHLASGAGFHWNLQGPAVEGYSNFFFVLLGAAAIHLAWEPMLTLKLVGLTSLFFTTLLLYRFSRRWLPPITALLVPFAYSIYLGTIWWTVSGMETAFFVLLILSVLILLFSTLERGPQLWVAIVLGVLLALAGLTRPEAPVLWIGMNIALVWILRRELAAWRYFFLLLNFSFLLPYGWYFLWRLWYFGRWFPNPVYCKAFDAHQPWTLIIEYLKLAFPFAAAAVNFRDPKRLLLWLPSVMYLLILVGANPIIAALTRHFLAGFALLLVMGLVGVYQWMERYQISGKFLVLFFLILSFVPQVSPTVLKAASDHYANRAALRERIAGELQPLLKPTDWVAMPDCGLIPFRLNANVIDTLCLNSREMTTKPIDYSYARFASWLLNDAKPQWILISSYPWAPYQDELGLIFQREQNLKKIFEKNYQLIKTDQDQQHYQYKIYQRSISVIASHAKQSSSDFE